MKKTGLVEMENIIENSKKMKKKNNIEMPKINNKENKKLNSEDFEKYLKLTPLPFITF